ncbi:hypothetical protein K438DRAFT_2032275 [Mycena galopus ATCC 62051]|nr:hypothetical protein K438DRAFT_2032275 [Mycena galopus ATCC 62051]
MPDPPSASNPSCAKFKNNVVETAKAAVGAAASALNIAASATQNVPYLGAISTALVEVSKIIDEVEVCKSTWEDVGEKIHQIQKIVDDFRRYLEQHGGDELEGKIMKDFKDFDKCLMNVIVTMDKCKTTSSFTRFVKRSKLTAAAQKCQKDIDKALQLFQINLQIDLWKHQKEMQKLVQEMHIVVTNPSHITQLNPSISAHVLPAPSSIFCGREEEVNQVVDLILNHGPVHVAIVGAGGIGKTSIALHSIHHSDVKEHFQQERFFLSCEAISTADSLALELLKLFGVSVDTGSSKLPDTGNSRSPSDNLTLHMQSMKSKCLLCLDNFETPWDSDKDKVESLLRNIAVPDIILVITSRDVDRPRGIKWAVFNVKTLTPDAAIETWDVISEDHDQFSVQLMEAVDNLPLAVTLLAQLAQAESSKELWRRWESKSIKLVTSDGIRHRLNSLEVSIELSLNSSRIQKCHGALDFFLVLCILPQGMPEWQITEFEMVFADALLELDQIITVQRQCSLAYTRDDFLCVLSPIRQYILSHRELSTSLSKNLFSQMAQVYLELISANSCINVLKETSNIATVLDICLTEDQPIVEEVMKFSDMSREQDLDTTELLLKATSIAHRHCPELEGNCHLKQGVTHVYFNRLLNAKQALDVALEIHRRTSNKQGQADTLQQLGLIYAKVVVEGRWNLTPLNNQTEQAEQVLRSALDLHTEVNDRSSQAYDLLFLGLLYKGMKRLKDSVQAFQSALDLDDKQVQANALTWLGGLYLSLDQPQDAEHALKLALNIFKEVNDMHGLGRCLCQWGEWYMKQDQPKQAEQALEAAFELHKNINDKSNQAKNLQKLGEVYIRLDRLEDAKHALQTAYDLHKEVDERTNQAYDLQALGPLYLRLNRLQDAQQAFQSAVNLYKEVGNLSGQAYNYQNLGELYMRLDQLPEAEQAFQSSLALYTETDDQSGQAKNYEKLGELYMRLDQLLEAEQAFQSSLALYTETDDQPGQAYAHQQLGDIYIQCDKLKYAEQALQAALDLYKELKDDHHQAYNHQNLGKLYLRLDQLQDAVQAFQSAFDLHKQEDEKLDQAHDLQKLGETYIRLDQLEDAKQALQAAHDLHKEIGEQTGQAYDLRTLGQLYLRLNQLQDAQQAFQSAVNLYKEGGDQPGQAHNHQNLGELYLRLDQLEDSVQAFQSAFDLHTEVDDQFGQAYSQLILGQIYTRLDQPDNAEQALQIALNLHKELKYDHGQAEDLQHMGVLYMQLKRLEDAEHALQSALNLHKNVKDKNKDLRYLKELSELVEAQNQNADMVA